EYPLDDARVDAIPAGNKMHTVFLYRSQAPVVIESNPLLDESITWHTDHHGLGWYTVTTWARDKDHALKVASDKAAEAQAKLLGLESLTMPRIPCILSMVGYPSWCVFLPLSNHQPRPPSSLGPGFGIFWTNVRI